MSYRQELEAFARRHPYEHMEAGGASFRFVRQGLENRTVLVFLNGGMNISEMWMSYVDSLSDEFGVLIFDYPYEARTNARLIEAMDAFFRALGIERPILVGASDGGMVAQLYARKYPENTGGLVLIATGGLDKQSLKTLRRKFFFTPLLLWYMKVCNYEKLKPSLIKMGLKYAEGESPEKQQYTLDMFTELMKDYTREKDLHITGLLADIIHQQPVEARDFAGLRGKIMLILPKEDFFPPSMQEDLKSLMQEPELRCISGGHISTVLQAQEYCGMIREFAEKIQG